MNLQEQIVYIAQRQEETRKFVAEQHRLTREATHAGWHIAIAGMTAGAALFGAGATFMSVSRFL